MKKIQKYRKHVKVYDEWRQRESETSMSSSFCDLAQAFRDIYAI